MLSFRINYAKLSFQLFNFIYVATRDRHAWPNAKWNPYLLIIFYFCVISSYTQSLRHLVLFYRVLSSVRTAVKLNTRWGMLLPFIFYISLTYHPRYLAGNLIQNIMHKNLVLRKMWANNEYILIRFKIQTSFWNFECYLFFLLFTYLVCYFIIPSITTSTFVMSVLVIYRIIFL